MLMLLGIAILTFMRSYRTNFLLAIQNNPKPVLSLNMLNESLYILATSHLRLHTCLLLPGSFSSQSHFSRSSSSWLAYS
jgi:hypothetical protein